MHVPVQPKILRISGKHLIYYPTLSEKYTEVRVRWISVVKIKCWMKNYRNCLYILCLVTTVFCPPLVHPTVGKWLNAVWNINYFIVYQLAYSICTSCKVDFTSHLVNKILSSEVLDLFTKKSRITGKFRYFVLDRNSAVWCRH